jgi:phospholipase C
LQATGLSSEARQKLQREIASLRAELQAAQAELTTYTDAAWTALPARTRALHEKAFTTNSGDPAYRALTKLAYQDGATRREVDVPAGDVLHQFRRDVSSGALPAVSWLVAPQNFSDHPSSAWYGAWYVSEVLDILTKNPEVWKKTIFILCYDENDGYFDHVPPYVAPHPSRPETGRVSAGIDTSVDWANVYGRDSSIGLGYRVPFVIASPWSRGGCVNSQVFDHTSVLRFLEVWLAAKGKSVKETNISDWRRLVCGDLTSVFRPYDGEAIDVPAPLDRDATVERIHSARYRQRPTGGGPLSRDAIAAANVGALQEAGTRPSCPLPYELVVNAEVRDGALTLTMEARTDAFGEAAQGAPFNAYSYGKELACRSYAVRAGDSVRDTFPISGAYRVRVDGPNGFMREFSGPQSSEPRIAITVRPGGGKSPTTRVWIQLENRDTASREAVIRDESYGAPVRQVSLPSRQHSIVELDASASQGWYDFTVRTEDVTWRFAGRVETGKWSITDPSMGRE